MIAWMLYTVLVGLCVCVAAAAADSLARMRGWPARVPWIAAAVLSVALSATARLRERAAPRADTPSLDISSLTLIQANVLSVERHVPPSSVWYVAALWGGASVLVTLSFVVVYVRLRRARHAWPAVELHGHHARVSPSFGPLVIGVARPEIVVPRWALDRSADEQRVMLAHEAEHVRAHDPLILASACALTALMPWNPTLWIILSRIRLAIEIDCDARVLRGGVSPRVYGTLLVDVAERTPSLRFATMALSDGSSHLHQRILAMQRRRITHPLTRGASVVLIGLASLLAACEAKMPTAADIDHMDAAAVERSARALGLPTTDTSVVWVVDGVISTEAAAKAIPVDSIVDVSVNRLGLSNALHMRVVTKAGLQLAAAARDSAQPTVARKRVGRDGPLDPIRGLQSAITNERPLIIIDGKRSDASALSSLDRDRIAAIEIRKGPLALKEFGDDAKNGVIVVRMK
jgi:beta-lactamase regulating signal transducer with metallopeptidase domain